MSRLREILYEEDKSSTDNVWYYAAILGALSKTEHTQDDIEDDLGEEFDTWEDAYEAAMDDALKNAKNIKAEFGEFVPDIEEMSSSQLTKRENTLKKEHPSVLSDIKRVTAKIKSPKSKKKTEAKPKAILRLIFPDQKPKYESGGGYKVSFDGKIKSMATKIKKLLQGKVDNLTVGDNKIYKDNIHIKCTFEGEDINIFLTQYSNGAEVFVTD